MKNLVLLPLLFVILNTFGQMDVKTTRPTYLLNERNQATFDAGIEIPAGVMLSILEYYPDGYFSVRYNNEDHFVYYPYFSEIVDIAGIKEKLAVHEDVEDNLTTTYAPSKTIHTGPRGGKYYINGNGKKTYVKKKKN